MTDLVIVFQNPDGPNVCVYYPIDASTIETTLESIPGGIIMEKSNLPNDTYFDAWRLQNGAIVVDLSAAKEVATSRLNSHATVVAQNRLNNVNIGLTNQMSNTDWLDLVNSKRSAIDAATTIEELSLVNYQI